MVDAYPEEHESLEEIGKVAPHRFEAGIRRGFPHSWHAVA